ncbi:MAG: transcriptional regulator GcvA [Halieaceae bacterium]|mgnify:CR=1 FL=1|jgi:LysR family transcriptional regulator, glycine cleavage system transcriptional activator|nr:transcriptional regulator GcvA [Halieaceae bacterium]
MSRKLPPLKALRAFEAAARHESFTRAASELHVTHGAISQQIRTLEEYYQQPLFVRSRGKVSLNSAGEKLLPVIGSALDRIEKVSDQLKSSTDDETLNIHLTAAFAGQWLIPRLSDFQQHYPNYTIHLSPAQTFSGFRDRQPDVAIRWGAMTLADVAMEKLFDVDTFAACAPSLLTGEHPLHTPGDLQYQTLIHDDDGEAWQAMLDEIEVDNLDQGKGLYYSDTSLALQVAREGQGVIVAGSVLAAQDLAAGRLVIPFPHFVHRRNAYYLYFPNTSANKPAVKIFREWIHLQAADYLKNQIDLQSYVITR